MDLLVGQNKRWDAIIQDGLIDTLRERTPDKRIFTPETQSFYLVERDKLLGGVILDVYGDILWVDALWVHAKHRRKKFGTVLMTEAHKFAVEKRCSEMQLHTFFEEMKAFYRTFDFAEVSEIPNWKYGRSCYFMRRVL